MNRPRFLFLTHLITALFCSIGTAKSEETTVIVKNTFSLAYPINYGKQTIESGTQLELKSTAKTAYLVKYNFGNSKTHIVKLDMASLANSRIEKSNGKSYLKIEQGLTTQFKKAYILFQKGEKYKLLEKNKKYYKIQYTFAGKQYSCKTSPTNFYSQGTKFISSASSSKRINVKDNREYAKKLKKYLASTPASKQIPRNAPIDAVCLIETRTGTGTGFLMRMNDRTYCISNIHVIGEIRDLKITKMNGDPLKLLFFEVAKDRDLARILVDGDHPAFEVQKAPHMREPIRILGNSGGAGLVTESRGQVIGMGVETVEISASFIEGNSGSPVLNENDDVVGVATYAIKAEMENEDWIRKGTRFSKARRICTRLDNTIEWIPTSPKNLEYQMASLQSHGDFLADLEIITKDLVAQDAKRKSSYRLLSTSNLQSKEVRNWALNYNRQINNMNAQTKEVLSRKKLTYKTIIDHQKNLEDRSRQIFRSLIALVQGKYNQLSSTQMNNDITYFKQSKDEYGAVYKAIISD